MNLTFSYWACVFLTSTVSVSIAIASRGCQLIFVVASVCCIRLWNLSPCIINREADQQMNDKKQLRTNLEYKPPRASAGAPSGVSRDHLT